MFSSSSLSVESSSLSVPGTYSEVSLSSVGSPSTLELVHAAVVDGDAGARLLVLGLCLDDHLDQFK